ncbi:MAG: CpaF family protein [Lachnobacterium sp.]|nr:CpaF family protein [Lachnobacterium sp.]MDY2912332.1 CpaF family protein [Agathobacter sp.]
MDEISEKVRKQVLSDIDVSRDLEDEEIWDIISRAASEEVKQKSISLRDRIELEKRVFDSLKRLDVLQELIDDTEVTEIMVNGPDSIFYEKNGCIQQYDGRFSSEEKMQDIIQQIVGRHNRVVNQSSPIVDTRLVDGSRVNIVLFPISLGGSAISIRKFPKEPYNMEKLIAIGSVSKEVSEMLKLLVKAKYSIFISGGTGSGKTTFLNALSQYIPEDERIITIEDSAELQLLGAKNIVRMETRNANVEGVMPITIRDLIRTALRMRPDRIIVGECRGAETLDMLSAMNTGHDGSLSTGHANSCRDMLSRMETMVLMGQELPLSAIRSQIASGINIIIQLGRLRDKSRRVLEIAELDGIVDGEIVLNTLYQFEEISEKDGRVIGELVQKGKLKSRTKLEAAGMRDIDGL